MQAFMMSSNMKRKTAKYFTKKTFKAKEGAKIKLYILLLICTKYKPTVPSLVPNFF